MGPAPVPPGQNDRLVLCPALVRNRCRNRVKLCAFAVADSFPPSDGHEVARTVENLHRASEIFSRDSVLPPRLPCVPAASCVRSRSSTCRRGNQVQSAERMQAQRPRTLAIIGDCEWRAKDTESFARRLDAAGPGAHPPPQSCPSPPRAKTSGWRLARAGRKSCRIVSVCSAKFCHRTDGHDVGRTLENFHSASEIFARDSPLPQ
jgi:hypothetical protein